MWGRLAACAPIGNLIDNQCKLRGYATREQDSILPHHSRNSRKENLRDQEHFARQESQQCLIFLVTEIE